MTYARDLLNSARKSLNEQHGITPTASDCNRAVSTAYYAVFDCICSTVANRLAGSLPHEDTPSESWVRVYRAIDHHVVRETLFRVTNAKDTSDNPLSFVATGFDRLLKARTHADYARNENFDVGAALGIIFEAQFVVDEVEEAEAMASENAAFLTQVIVELILPKPKR